MARPTPEEIARIKAKYATAPAAIPATAIPVDPANRQKRLQAEEKMKAAKSAQDALTAVAERKRVDIELERQQTGADFSQEVARLNAEEDVKASSPPIYVGAYDPGLTTPLFGAVPPARPMNIAVPKAEAPGLMEAMRPQTMAPANVAMQSANRTAEVFDEKAFMESIAALPTADKQQAINTHNAFKSGFFRLRSLNPVETGVTDEELLKELRQQITEFETGTGPTVTQGTANRGDIGGALERRVTPATLRLAKAGALTYFSELSSTMQSAGAEDAANVAAAALTRNGVPVMAPVPGNREGLERQTGTRAATPADVTRIKEAARKAYNEENPIPLSMLANRDELLANSEKSATGGTLFQKEYITGATVESSMSHALRSAFALPNYIAGEVVDKLPAVTFGLLGMGPETRAREQAGRPAGMKDVSPGVYNVAVGGGFFKPIADMWTYSPVELVRDNAYIGQAFGLAADLLTLEVGAVGGIASGARAAVGATKAAKMAGADRLGSLAMGAFEGGRTGVATTVRSIGLPSLAKKIAPGDIRLVGASSVGENYKALAAYENDIANGGIPSTALQAAKDVAPNSAAVAQMAKRGPSFNPVAYIKDSKAEYNEFKELNDILSKVEAGDVTADVVKLRPYLRAGMTEQSAAGVAARLSPPFPEVPVVNEAVVRAFPSTTNPGTAMTAAEWGSIPGTTRKNPAAVIRNALTNEADDALARELIGDSITPGDLAITAEGKSSLIVSIDRSSPDVGFEVTVLEGGKYKQMDLGVFLLKNNDQREQINGRIVAMLEEAEAVQAAAAAARNARFEAGQRTLAGRQTLTLKVKDVVDEIKNTGNLSDVRSAIAFDKGFKAIDRAVGSIEPGKEVIAITPKTFGTKKVADEVIAAAAETEAGKLFARVTDSAMKKKESRKLLSGDVPVRKPEEFQFKLGGRTVTDTGYKLTEGEKTEFIKVLTQEANTGTMSKSAVNKAIQELSATPSSISSTSIRELSYSVVDGVADKIRLSSPMRGLSDIGKGTFASTALANKAKAITYGEQTSSIKLAIEKVAKQFTTGIGTSEDVKLARILDEVQLEQVRAAKSKIGQIDKMLANEFGALDNPVVAARYGLGPNPNRSQKMAAITLGEKPAPFNVKTTLYNYLRSTMFGTTNLSKWRMFGDFTPAKGFEYSTFEQIFNPAGLAEIEKIVDKYVDLIKTPDDALRFLPQMTDEVEDLTTAMQTVTKELSTRSVGYAAVGTATTKPAFLVREFGGKVGEPSIFRLRRPEEALIGTYARNKGDELFVDAMANILANDPLTYAATTGGLQKIVGDALPLQQIVQRAVANQIGGGAPITGLADLYKVNGMKAILDKPLGSTTVGAYLATVINNRMPAFGDLIEDINATAAVVARKFGGGVPSVEFTYELQQIANGNIRISELGGAPNPFSLRNAVRSQLGKEANYNDLITELGKIAEAEARGDLNAAKVNRTINALLDITNSFFYNAILSYNPRFHGRNILSAPLIVHMTTGIGLTYKDVLRGARVLDPVSVRGLKDIGNDVVAVDKLGNSYTSLELHKLAVESGILKTEMSANVDARFLDEAAKLGLGESTYAKFPISMKVLSYPSQLANAEDNMWRMATVIHGLENGETLEGALQLGRRSLFDFGSTSAFERKYVARKVLFWNYFRNSILAGTKSLLENPGRTIRQYRVATDVSKIAVGDTDWNNLRLYGPMDAGVTSIALKYAPSSRREGHVTVLPNMPYADMAAISAGLLYSPMDYLAGQKDLVSGERDYGKGFIINKLSPGPRATFNFIAGQTMDDVKMKKNMLSPTHVAAAAAFEAATGIPAVAGLVGMFDAKPRPAVEGEKAFDGVVYELSPQDFDNYRMYLVKTIQYSGASRFVNDWSKAYSGEATLPQFIGLTSKYSAPTPESLQRGAADISTEALEAGTTEKEVDASLKRPKAPSATGRIK